MKEKTTEVLVIGVVFMIGVILFLAGFFLYFHIPGAVTWGQRSKILASEEALTISPRWNPKSEVLADNESLSTSALWLSKSEVLADGKSLSTSPSWQSKNRSVIDKVIVVDYYETYDYWEGYRHFFWDDVENIVVNGTATETSSPSRSFNLYIMDSTNFDLWKAGNLIRLFMKPRIKPPSPLAFQLQPKKRFHHISTSLLRNQ